MRRKGVVIDRDTIAVLKGMKDKALITKSENGEGSDEYAAMYCGALLFARDRRLLTTDVARHMFEQFRKDFEKLDESETPAREESEK